MHLVPPASTIAAQFQRPAVLVVEHWLAMEIAGQVKPVLVSIYSKFRSRGMSVT